MTTLRLPIDPGNLDCQSSRNAIRRAAAILREGGLVAFPTETVYGLGANALDSTAVEKIFAAKRRPSWDPLIVHISDPAMLASIVASESSASAKLVAAFWPGPLTLLLPKTEIVPLIVTAGRPLIGVRRPAHPVANALIAEAGIPVAAPSANSFGRISPTTAAHVLEDLEGRIDAILDGGETTHGLESTVVDASRDPVIVYRPGIITLDAIRKVCPSAVEWKPSGSGEETRAEERHTLPSPGMGIRHYAPHARLVLIGGAAAEQAGTFLRAVQGAEGRPVGIMLPANFLAQDFSGFRNVLTYHWGDWHNLPMLAHRLFAGLRELDAAGLEVIFCPLPPAHGVGAAIQDRLLKAAKSE